MLSLTLGRGGRFRRAVVAAAIAVGALVLSLQAPGAVHAAAIGTPVITSPTDASSTYNGMITVSGTASPHDLVSVRAPAELCSAVADSQGSWSCQPDGPLSPATYTIAAVVTLMTGTELRSNSIVVTVFPPVSFAITSPEQNGTVATATPTVSGNATPGDTVIVAATSGGDPLCTATVGPDTTWSCTVSALSVGYHSLAVRLNGTEQGNASFTVAPAVPAVITSPTSGQSVPLPLLSFSGTAAPSEHVQVWLTQPGMPHLFGICETDADSEGNWECSVVVPPGTNVGTFEFVAYTTVDSAPVSLTILPAPTTPLLITSPTAGSTVTTATPTVAGTAESGATVSVLSDPEGDPLCTAVADENGDWSCTVTALPEGDNTLYASLGEGDTPSVTFTVAISKGGSTDTTPTAATLAYTGSDSGAALLVLGAALLTILTGAGLVIVRRRQAL